ncbi:MAG: hypothetical protein M3273_04130, partial [Actinomycetota bacterium]|nr:hypothetical protein [Actinomycetota bacterium]
MSSLEERLERAGRAMQWPAVPDVSVAVRAAVSGTPARGLRWWTKPVAAAGLAVLALVVALSGVLALSPATRRAVADWLGVRGIHIAFLEEGATPRPTGHGLSLGTATALEAAEDDAGFDVLAPDPAVYGSP